MTGPANRSPNAGEHVFVALVALLSGLYIARGLIAVNAGTFQGTTRYSGSYEIVGSAARLMGAGHVLLGVFVLLALAAWIWRQRVLAGLAAGSCLAAIGCLIVAYAGR